MIEYYEYKPIDYEKERATLESVLLLLAEAVREATATSTNEVARQRGSEALRAAQVYVGYSAALDVAPEGER